MNDEFYIGYLKQAPPKLSKTVRAIALGILVVCVGVAFAAATQQQPADSGVYEFGVEKTFEGYLSETPLPNILITGDHEEAGKRFLITSFGKAGMPDFARDAIGKHIRFGGSLIYRQNMTMIELNNPDAFEVIPGESRVASVNFYGETTLTGELVDTKCFFGVMRPGFGKVHRGCASVCLRGGVPPGLLIRQDDGRGTVVMIADAEIDPEWAALDIEVSGELEMHGDLPVIRATSVAIADE